MSVARVWHWQISLEQTAGDQSKCDSPIVERGLGVVGWILWVVHDGHWSILMEQGLCICSWGMHETTSRAISLIQSYLIPPTQHEQSVSMHEQHIPQVLPLHWHFLEVIQIQWPKCNFHVTTATGPQQKAMRHPRVSMLPTKQMLDVQHHPEPKRSMWSTWI